MIKFALIQRPIYTFTAFSPKRSTSTDWTVELGMEEIFDVLQFAEEKKGALKVVFSQAPSDQRK